jgi:hypothetical protein
VRTAVISLLLIASSAPGLLACAVCGLASASDNQSAYASMSVMLSAIPLSIFAGVAIWIYRRSR